MTNHRYFTNTMYQLPILLYTILPILLSEVSMDQLPVLRTVCSFRHHYKLIIKIIHTASCSIHFELSALSAFDEGSGSKYIHYLILQ